MVLRLSDSRLLNAKARLTLGLRLSRSIQGKVTQRLVIRVCTIHD